MSRRRTLTALGAAAAGAAVLRRRTQTPPATTGGPAAAPPPPGRTSTVTAEDGVALAVLEHGAAAADASGTVLLLHGYGQSRRLWGGQVQDLLAVRPDLRVVTYDHRGHGGSQRCTPGSAHLEQLGRDLQQVLEQVAPTGPVLLAGHSMGGMVIMVLAEQRPELFGRAADGARVVGAAFVATSAGGLADVRFGLPAPLGRLVEAARPSLNARAVRAEQAGRPRRLAPGTMRLVFGVQPTAEDLALTEADMLACSAETVAAFGGAFAGHDRVAALKALHDVPSVVLHGDRDRLCPLAHGRVVADALGSGELAVYPGAGHMLQLERREEVSRALLTLAARVLTPDAARTAAPSA